MSRHHFSRNISPGKFPTVQGFKSVGKFLTPLEKPSYRNVNQTSNVETHKMRLLTERRSRFLTGLRGFTLVEILIVVVIIGILASLVLPRFTGQAEKARVAEAIQFSSAIRRGQLAYFNETSGYLPLGPSSSLADWAKIGLEQPVNDSTKVYWLYYVLNFDFGTFYKKGMVYASRTPFRADSTVQYQVLVLYPDGSWGGTGPYAPGQRYAPSK